MQNELDEALKRIWNITGGNIELTPDCTSIDCMSLEQMTPLGYSKIPELKITLRALMKETSKIIIEPYIKEKNKEEWINVYSLPNGLYDFGGEVFSTEEQAILNDEVNFSKYGKLKAVGRCKVKK